MTQKMPLWAARNIVKAVIAARTHQFPKKPDPVAYQAALEVIG